MKYKYYVKSGCSLVKSSLKIVYKTNNKSAAFRYAWLATDRDEFLNIYERNKFLCTTVHRIKREA